MFENIEEQISKELKEGNYQEAANLLEYHPDKTGDMYLFDKAVVLAYLEEPAKAIECMNTILAEIAAPELRAIVYGFIADIRQHNNQLCEAYSDILKALDLKPFDDQIIKTCKEIQIALIEKYGPLQFVLQTKDKLRAC